MKRHLGDLDRRSIRWFVVAFLIATSSVFACQVPVFRYALERWQPDRYEIVVLHDQPLSAAQRGQLDELRASYLEAPKAANFEVHTIAMGDVEDEFLKALWQRHGKPGEPVLSLFYPRNAHEIPDRLAFASPLAGVQPQHVVDSPLRQKVAKRLGDGQSAVWIFVPCGRAKEDEQAFQTLVEHVKWNETNLELPPLEETEEEELLLKDIDIDLRIEFSVVTLEREDPKEQALLKMLLGSESDLEELDQPMAFPVFGRGRVLYALVGKGISEQTIGSASAFMVGPCSCQVKSQNPGFDLLMTYDWDEKVAGSMISDPLPETSSEPVLLTIPPGRSSR